MDEQVLYESHPKMFKNNCIGFIFCVILISAYGLGIIILLIWWLRTLGIKLIASSERITLRKGILSKHTNEVYHTDVRNIQISQGLLQRFFNVGKIGISTAGQGGIEIEVQGMPYPQKIKTIIDQYRRQK